jgi:hypothetical protein
LRFTDSNQAKNKILIMPNIAVIRGYSFELRKKPRIVGRVAVRASRGRYWAVTIK